MHVEYYQFYIVNLSFSSVNQFMPKYTLEKLLTLRTQAGGRVCNTFINYSFNNHIITSNKVIEECLMKGLFTNVRARLSDNRKTG